MRLSHLSASLLAGLAALALSACHADPNEEAAQCPKAYLLPDASRLARYDGRGQDISNLVLNVRLTDVQGACSGKLGTKLEGAHAHVVMVVTRGPASTSSQADVAYKIGVIRGNDIIAENSYTQHVTFPDNVNAVQVTGQEIPMKLPTSKTVLGPSYHIYFWLDLTREEVEANRRNPSG
jgi:hypothetical protein